MPKIKVNNIQLNYEIVGEGEPLLFLHGLGSSLNDWYEQVPFFKKNYQVITLDVRGHGDSDKPNSPYSVKLWAEDVQVFLQKMKLKSVHIVGYSMGGAIAYQLATTIPNSIKSLMIVNALPDFRIHTLERKWMYWQRKILLNMFNLNILAKVISRRLFPKAEQKELRKRFMEGAMKNDKKVYYNAFLGLVGWSVHDKLSTINIPTLILSGDKDYYAVPVKQGYADEMPNAKVVVIKDSTHATPIDQKDRFNEEVTRFLQNLVN